MEVAPTTTARDRLRIGGIVLGTAAAAVWILAGLGDLLSNGVTSDQFAVAAALAALVVVNAAGALVAWFNARRGGVWLVLAGSALFAFSLAAASRNRVSTALLSGLPFIVAGLLLLAAGADRRRPPAQPPSQEGA